VCGIYLGPSRNRSLLESIGQVLKKSGAEARLEEAVKVDSQSLGSPISLTSHILHRRRFPRNSVSPS
jgi:hypothetical protein